ncbi:hypothetical protein LZ575_02015 [Antarcticibacterium sp. 1MA-6-2]|uniref:hypothetical protein n=1 Tax=Antarcticibacterium sp. 1MA-6-2 TaxID=2908210 RepID=UPI001F1991CB|nr:hypothetical protein [Antarcticibacterium sp. 1MA-6-2]UJH91534.1 hypothetical protein LZ575_02015 [Antarcticibacterium sp. 1MA-6-2]
MKKITFLVALFFIGWTGYASTANLLRPNYGEAFIFIERGVEFAVYPNGEFDFYYNPQFLNTSPMQIGHPGYNISYNAYHNYDAFVQYDDFGAVIQIESVPVYYDYYGRLVQAGDVVIHYNSIGRIARIGGMKVRYNSFGQPIRYVGYINRYNTAYVYRPWHTYYVRPHVNHRIVYYEPYRAYYELMRIDYYQYANYYQSNNYYYNKTNFYRPGQQVATYNYGRRTMEQKDPAPAVRSNQNSTREYASTSGVRSNSNTNRTAVRDSYSSSRERRNLEQHEAAVRAQRGTAQVQSTGRTVETRSVSRRSVPENSVQTRTAERSSTVNNPVVRRQVETPAVRSNNQERNVRVESNSNTNRSSARSSETSRSSAPEPVSREASSGRRSSGIRG